MGSKVTTLSGLVTLTAVLSAGAVIVPTRTGVPKAATWQGTILCTAKTASGYHSLAVDKSGRLVGLTLRRAVAPGLGVQVQVPHGSRAYRTLAARDLGTVRVLRQPSGPLVVRAKLIEDGYSRYGFDRNGRPWGCPVTFGNAAAVSVAQLILSDRSAQVTLVVRNGRLVHVGPRQRPLAQSARHARAAADAEQFLALLARGDSIAMCSTASTDFLRIHGGRDGCVMTFESAKFVYRDHYAGAAVKGVDLFELGGSSYALATIARHIGKTRVILVFERGRYRYLGDFSLSPIELW